MNNAQAPISSAQDLIQFTGYYTIDPSVGSFVMVDTHSVWTAGQGGGAPTIDYFGTITLSSDGQTSAKYELGEYCTFDGKTLLITDPTGATVAQLSFSGGGSSASTMQGTLRGQPVSGTTPFGPVQLPIWTGTYYLQGVPEQHGGLLQYPYTPALVIGAEGAVQFAVGGQLQPVPSYWYDYGMFVIGIMMSPGAPSTLYEMGTSSGWGRVAGNASDGVMLVSVQLQQPAPHL